MRAETRDNCNDASVKPLPKAQLLKSSIWKTGFWGEKASGWHYNLLFVLMSLAILCSGDGRIALMPN